MHPGPGHNTINDSHQMLQTQLAHNGDMQFVQTGIH
jgi:hypothetical protein